MRVIIGVTGASGIQYAMRAAEVLEGLGFEVHSIISDGALATAAAEGIDGLRERMSAHSAMVYGEHEMAAAISSSSFVVQGMAVMPCSIKTLGEIASGITSNLITRSAINSLRMGRRLALVLRETPLGQIELENALRAARAGAFIVPASPGFYTKPRGIDDIIDFVVGKTLDVLGIEHSVYRRWGSDNAHDMAGGAIG